MKRFLIFLNLVLAANIFADEPLQLQTPLTADFQTVLKLVRENLNGWTKLNFDRNRTLWTPHSFYAEKISDPKKWVSQIKEMGFCQPDKMWKSFPVLSVSNDQIATGFETVAAHPNANFMTALTYSETVIVGGKARTISYDYNQNGSNVNITCSAGNELGDVQSIKQTFDIKNPKTFNVEQKKNGKLLQI